MRKLILCLIPLIAFAGPVLAADMPVQAPMGRAAYYPQPVHFWTGKLTPS